VTARKWGYPSEMEVLKTSHGQFVIKRSYRSSAVIPGGALAQSWSHLGRIVGAALSAVDTRASLMVIKSPFGVRDLPDAHPSQIVRRP
jgi:hypothetical protein